jgi:hypothetical protein
MGLRHHAPQASLGDQDFSPDLIDKTILIEQTRGGYQCPMSIKSCQIRSQARDLRAAAEVVLAGALPLSDGDIAYLAGVVDFADEFLDVV